MDRLGKPNQSFGSVCWNSSLGGLICLVGSGWFSLIRAENKSPFVLLDS